MNHGVFFFLTAEKHPIVTFWGHIRLYFSISMFNMEIKIKLDEKCINSSIGGHFGCSHILAIVNAAVNIGCKYLFDILISFPSDIFPGVELLNPMYSSSFNV